VCLSQSPLACVETDPRGRPDRDPDSNGSPRHGRRHALTLLRSAHALLISGDQHLGSLVRHGIDTFTDGPIQFTPPAAGTAWQRWVEPAADLPHSRGPHTGNYTDGFGNKLRVLAVANPRISYAEVDRAQPHRNDVGDQRLKREGYGILRIDKTTQTYHLECWPWHVDPTSRGATQYPGWPYVVAFRNA
jgi:alkaline phosphatase D